MEGARPRCRAGPVRTRLVLGVLSGPAGRTAAVSLGNLRGFLLYMLADSYYNGKHHGLTGGCHLPGNPPPQ